MIVLIHLISDFGAPECIAQALLILFRVIGDPKIDEVDKILPTDLIGRLARIPTGKFQVRKKKSIIQKSIIQGFGIHKHSGLNIILYEE
jgi:hypothetical protein